MAELAYAPGRGPGPRGIRVRLPASTPCARTPIGRGPGFKPRSVSVRIRPSAPTLARCVFGPPILGESDIVRTGAGRVETSARQHDLEIERRGVTHDHRHSGVPVTVGGGGSSSGKLVTACATDAHCESGEKCCSITGVCYDSSLPVLCSFPPPGSSVPCLDDSHCMDGVEYCSGAGCTGPGGCVSMPGTGSCTGEFTPVCGCNGKTYTNAACASVEGARLAHDGQCP